LNPRSFRQILINFQRPKYGEKPYFLQKPFQMKSRMVSAVRILFSPREYIIIKFLKKSRGKDTQASIIFIFLTMSRFKLSDHSPQNPGFDFLKLFWI